MRAFDRSLCQRLTGLRTPHVPPEHLDGTVETIVIFTEGLLGRRLPAAERHRRLTTALNALLPPTG